MEQIHEDLLQKLIRNREAVAVSQDIEDMNEKGRSPQLRYVYEVLRRHKMLPDASQWIEGKCDKKAEEYRNKGNALYASNQFLAAIEMYNQSLCHAETDGDLYHLSVGFANRSAVFFKLKMYQECLDSIRLAKEHQYPDQLLHKLQKRESNCTEMINRNRKNEPKNIITNFKPKLSYPANKKVPFIIDALKCCVSEDLGRHVITQRKLNAGDIIAFEQPYSTCIMPGFRYKRCANCLLERQHLLIPCHRCTQTMFCCKECEQEAQENYHKIECPIVGALFELATEQTLIAIRTVIVTFNLFNDFGQFQEFVDRIDCKNVNVFTVNYAKGSTKKDQYLPVHTLTTNEEIIKRPFKFRKFVFAALSLHLFREYTSLRDYLKTEADENFFMEIVYHHTLTATMNMHGMDIIDPFCEESNCMDTSYGSGSFPFLSMCNHSCIPNTVRLPFGRNYAFLVLRNIPANGHVWDNYGIHHCIHTLEERQAKLSQQYQFPCKCQACVNDFPLYKGLPMPKEVPDCRTPEDSVENALQFKWAYAKGGLQRFSKYLRDNSKYSPCAQLCRAEEYLKFCYQILAGNISLEMKFQSPPPPQQEEEE